MNKKHLLTFSLLLSMLAANEQAAWAQVSGSTVHVLLQDRQLSAEVNGRAAALEVPAEIVNGSFYIPMKWVGQQLGVKTIWNPERRTIGLTTAQAYVEWDLDRGTASVNGAEAPLEETAFIRSGTLLVKLDWIAPYLQVRSSYQSDSNRVELTYLQKTDTAYRESVHPGDTQPNSRPTAIFYMDKAVYRIGEPVSYIDISYDPDAEGLPKYKWSGQRDAFFEPGTYPVSLQVSDGIGAWSHPFTQTVTVTDEIFLTASEYPWYTKPVGSMIKDESEEWKSKLSAAPEMYSIVTKSEDRKRIVSGENHIIQDTGLILKAQFNGKARLFSQHINGLKEKVQFAAVIHNPDQVKKLTVHVSRQGQIQPTLFHQQSTVEAVANYLTQPSSGDVIEIEPGKTAALERYTMEPGQGFVSIKDMETDGESELGFVVTKANEELKPLASYVKTDRANVTSAVYASSELRMDADADAANLTALKKWTVGSSGMNGGAVSSDPGTVYSLHLYHPRKAAVALQAKEGYLNGIVKVNGTIVPLPQGGITDQDGALLVYRSDGTERAIDIEWMPAPGSKLPVEWIFYPLADKK